MCQKGGPRCENADAYLRHKRKVERSEKYRNASEYEKEKILAATERTWKQKNKKLVQDHAPDKLWFHTKAEKKSTTQIKTVASHYDTFSAPVENYDVNELIEENQKTQELLSDDKYYALKNYSILGSLRVNSLLRGHKKNEDYPGDDESIERTQQQISQMDACFDTINETSPLDTDHDHELYREIPVPDGWTAKQYINKYYPTGEVIEDSGYVSTTHSPTHIVERAQKSKKKHSPSIVFKIHSRKGITLQEETPSYSTVQSREFERVLPRNHRMVVLGVSQQEYTKDENIEEVSSLFRSPSPDDNSVKAHTVHLVDEDLFKSIASSGK